LSLKLIPHLAIGRFPFIGLWKDLKFVFLNYVDRAGIF
nr:hypothetical protein [Tanacetum cinerariifolium]